MQARAEQMPPRRCSSLRTRESDLLQSMLPACMRTLFITIGCLLFCGCDTKKITQQQVIDASGHNRLSLILIRAGSSPFSKGYDFDSLVWQTNSGFGWHDRLAISQVAFQGHSRRERWVSEIHSIDAARGTAILKLAEGDVAVGSPKIEYI